MPRTAATPILLSAPREGRARVALRRAPPAGQARRPGRWIGAAEVTVGAALVALWALLWTVFVVGVLAPAGGLSGHGRAGAPPRAERPPLVRAP